MSSAPGRPPRPVTPRPVKPRPVKPWQRVEAGRYRSSDDRFTLESDGSGRWFVTDEGELDDLGLARTIGPFATLEAARDAAEAARRRPPAASPLAAQPADAASRPKRTTSAAEPATTTPTSTRPGPEAPPRTWLDDLGDRDPAAARRARRLIDALAGAGIAGADSLVRRDVLGDTPAVAARLLALDLAAAVARLQDPRPTDIVEAVAAVLAGSPSPSRDGLPGWELVERGGPREPARRLRLAAEDLR